MVAPVAVPDVPLPRRERVARASIHRALDRLKPSAKTIITGASLQPVSGILFEILLSCNNAGLATLPSKK